MAQSLHSGTVDTRHGRPARIAGRLLLVLLPLVFALHAPAAPADNIRRGDHGESHGREHREAERRDIGPAGAASIARRRFGGKVLKVESHGAVYRVKLLSPDGKVKSVYIEAAQ